MLVSERKTNSSVSNPIFQMCCAAGQAMVTPLQPFPMTIVDSLTRNNATGKEFMKNICAYNLGLSFKFLNADLNRNHANEENGAYTFRFHGSVHHLFSPELIPNEKNAIQQNRNAQIYILDSANKLRNRMNVAGNCEVSPRNMQSLQNMLHALNPFVEDLFKTTEEINAELPGLIRELRAESNPTAR
ncbi:hypothetical protein [Parasitella parasitica]|uniref:Helitron helicase-like domain-containing protein n=1 Tax=Parasitella parasitica TaxID=35722 RepID=A0A0B7MY37_9FUNG|nr:hypothetical protein [Parasitella parasitica]